jgi:hypothetical protein
MVFGLAHKQGLKDHKVLSADKEQQELLVSKVHLDRKVFKALREIRERKVHKETKVHKVVLVLQVFRVRRAIKVLLAQLVHKV